MAIEGTNIDKTYMNILVIGLGSMGTRRIRLLKRMDKESFRNIVIVGVDSNPSRRKNAEDLYSIKTYTSIEDALNSSEIDAAVVSAAPLSHAEIITKCLNEHIHVFSEINLVSEGYEENITLAKKNECVLFLSSTPMYRKEIQFIKETTKKMSKGAYHYHIGQYLPDWHPWENYKDYFVGDKRSNGCREIFAIELPWLMDTFGAVKRCQTMHGKISRLDLPYDDCYLVNIEHESGIIGTISVDVVTPKGGREFELWSENFYVEWKGTPDSLSEYDAIDKRLNQIHLYECYEHDDNYNSFVIEDAYYDELVNFLEVIDGKQIGRHSFENDLSVLSIIDEIEEQK